MRSYILTRRRTRSSTPCSVWLILCCLSIFLSSCTNILNSTDAATSTVATTHAAQPKADATGAPLEATTSARLARVQQIMKGMSLAQKLGQMIMVEYFGSSDGYEGTDLPAMIKQDYVGGVLYQAVNNDFIAPADTVSGLKSVSDQAMQDAQIPLLMAIDQEGGQVAKLSTLFGPVPSAAQMAQSGNPNTALKEAEQDATWMKEVGINVDLAPVVDVGPETNLLEDRQFSDNPQTVSTYAGAFLNGLQQNGIIGTLKHFPGLGSLANDPAEDPHQHLPMVTRTLSQLESIDFVPYKTLIQQDNPAMVMTTDVIDPAIDATLPGEFSPQAIHILRQQLGFNGVIITDGLYMVDETWSLSQAAVMSVEAGNDMIEGPYTADQVSSVVAAIEQAIQAGHISQASIDQSVQRILLMKMQYGLLK